MQRKSKICVWQMSSSQRLPGTRCAHLPVLQLQTEQDNDLMSLRDSNDPL